MPSVTSWVHQYQKTPKKQMKDKAKIKSAR